MDGTEPTDNGPDLELGIELSRLTEGAIVKGHVQGEPVLLVRSAGKLRAVGGKCTHYGAPLADGLVVDGTLRCPWHHACFSLRTGAALRAPALDPLPCWRVEERDGKAFVGGKLAPPAAAALPDMAVAPASIVIVGGGAAGHVAAETLRREGYSGSITLLSADSDAPCDRTNLSKGYLAGTIEEAWVGLRPPEFYQEHRIELKLGARVATIDTAQRSVRLEDGTRHSYEALLLATGAEPVRLQIPGADLPHVHTLRSFADSRALIQRAESSKRAVVVGASFIGLEVAAALRARGIEVSVVAPDAVPMERVLGREVGEGFRRLHEAHGVKFHLGTKPASIDAGSVLLENGERLPADLVVVGIGVRPALALAEQAGLTLERGVAVDERLRTSVPGVFAAGDIARWPDPHTGERIRVEHWIVAERQGACAARNMLGHHERFDAVPVFWTEQYDVTLLYVGHAESWDEVVVDGRFDDHDLAVTYRKAGRTLALATIYRDMVSLRAEAQFEAALPKPGH